MRFDDPPPEPLASAPGFLLSWNGQRMAHKFAAALEPLGLRPPHFGVMTLIDAHPGLRPAGARDRLADRPQLDGGRDRRARGRWASPSAAGIATTAASTRST